MGINTKQYDIIIADGGTPAQFSLVILQKTEHKHFLLKAQELPEKNHIVRFNLNIFRDLLEEEFQEINSVPIL